MKTKFFYLKFKKKLGGNHKHLQRGDVGGLLCGSGHVDCLWCGGGEGAEQRQFKLSFFVFWALMRGIRGIALDLPCPSVRCH